MTKQLTNKRNEINAQEDQEVINRHIDSVLSEQPIRRLVTSGPSRGFLSTAQNIEHFLKHCPNGRGYSPERVESIVRSEAKRYSTLLTLILSNRGVHADAEHIYNYLANKRDRMPRPAGEVYQLVKPLFNRFPISDGYEETPFVGWLNCQFLNDDKSKTYGDSYARLVQSCAAGFL